MKSIWKFNNITSIGKNTKQDIRCREMYEELDNTAIPMLTNDLNLQTKIEQLAINQFVRGYKKAENKYLRKISEDRHRMKVFLQRIRGLEAMLKEEQKSGKNTK